MFQQFWFAVWLLLKVQKCVHPNSFFSATQRFNHLETQTVINPIQNSPYLICNPYQASFRGCRVCLRKNFLCCVVSYGITKCRCTHDLGINTLPSSVTIRYNLYIYIMYSTISKIVSTIRIKLVQPHLGSYLVIIWFISRHTWAIPNHTHTHNSPFSFQN